MTSNDDIFNKLGQIEGKIDGINNWMLHKEKNCDIHWAKTNNIEAWKNTQEGQKQATGWMITKLIALAGLIGAAAGLLIHNGCNYGK